MASENTSGYSFPFSSFHLTKGKKMNNQSPIQNRTEYNQENHIPSLKSGSGKNFLSESDLKCLEDALLDEDSFDFDQNHTSSGLFSSAPENSLLLDHSFFEFKLEDALLEDSSSNVEKSTADQTPGSSESEDFLFSNHTFDPELWDTNSCSDLELLAMFFDLLPEVKPKKYPCQDQRENILLESD